MPDKRPHWRDLKERSAGFWQMRAMLAAYKVLGPSGLRFLIIPAVFFVFLFSPRLRRISKDYLARAAAFHAKSAPRPLDGMRHILAFAYSMVEKIAAWSNDIELASVRFHDDDVRSLIARLERGEGAVVVCSHFGNAELLRALATHNETRVSRPFGVTSIVDFTGTADFNRLLKTIDPDSMHRLLSARDLGLDAVIEMQRRLAEGELVVIAGDRTASTNRDRVERVSFLGADAEFPQGAFILASLLEAPVYFMFGLRVEDLRPASDYELHVYEAKTAFGSSRKRRAENIRALVLEFVAHLERFAAEHPLQWYNFYDFWIEVDSGNQEHKKP